METEQWRSLIQVCEYFRGIKDLFDVFDTHRVQNKSVVIMLTDTGDNPDFS